MADNRTPRQRHEWSIMYLCSHEIEAGKLLAELQDLMDPANIGGSPHPEQNRVRADSAVRVARKLTKALERVTSCWGAVSYELEKIHSEKRD